MRHSKKFSAGILPPLLCLAAALVVACNSGYNGPTLTKLPTRAPASQQIFVDPEEGVSDIATLDPGLSTDLPSIAAIEMVFTGLVQLNDQLQVVPQEAATYSVSGDGLTWTFHLRPDLKFSDGTPLTSANVAYSIDRALQPAEKSPCGPGHLALIKDSDKLLAGKIQTVIGDSVLTPDPNTVVLIANKKASYFLDALTSSCSYTVEKSLVDRYGTSFTDHLSEGGGAGPFKVKSYIHNREIDFVPNPYYYGPRPQLQEVKFPFYSQADTTYLAYQAGQVDFSTVPTADIDAAKNLPAGQFHLVPQLFVTYYTMNYLTRPFDNIDIRQAFALAINKTAIVKAAWKVNIPTNHIVPQGMSGYDASLTGPDNTVETTGNPALARQLLQTGLRQEGWSSVSQMPPITLAYPTGGGSGWDNEVAALQQTWQDVLGISVKVTPTGFNELLSEITSATNNPHGLQFWEWFWSADYPDPQDWTTLQFDSGSPNNNMNYGQNNSSDAAQQRATQQLLEQADVNADPASRLQQYNMAEQQLVNDVAWLPMEQFPAAEVLKPYVKSFVFNAEGLIPPDDWGAIYIAPH